MSKTIIVSNRLPVRIQKRGGKLVSAPSEGGLATGLGAVYAQGNNIWIGWPGLVVRKEDEAQINALLTPDNLIPVYLNNAEIKGYYEGFSNEVLWPVFHYISSYAQFDKQHWQSYKDVNQKFFNTLKPYIDPGDTIWIHDYHLLLLLQLIREEFKDITLGYFQHIPFPSHEIFRLIPWRDELLKGMLGADLLGFHTFDDVRHFISATAHLLSVQVDVNRIWYQDRIIVAEPFPMGIDYEKFAQLSHSKIVKKHIQALRQQYGAQKVILTIDRLDYSKGILQRLMAFEQFLIENPGWHEQVLLYMIVVPSRDNVEEYHRLKDEIDRYVGHINALYRNVDWYPIVYFYQSFPLEFLSALYNYADICLVSPLRDGMNLVSKEYVASRCREDGVLILSELAGASRELFDAIIINPYNIEGVKEAIIKALTLPKKMQQQRMQAMRYLVKKHDIHKWINLFLHRLKEVKEMQDSMQAGHLYKKRLDQVMQLYQQANQRLFLLDYDGTLVDFQRKIEAAVPDQELPEILNALDQDPKNHIAIISGRKYTHLEHWFGHRNFDLIAEHGAWIKKGGTTWVQKPALSTSWMPKVRQLMESFSDRTPGAFIEEKSYSLAWHYRKVQKGLGALRAHELMDNLRYLITSDGLQLFDGNKVVEVNNPEVNKGKAALALIRDIPTDFIFSIGDDHTDEDIFKALPDRAITVKVGGHISAARYFVHSYLETRYILKKFISWKAELSH